MDSTNVSHEMSPGISLLTNPPTNTHGFEHLSDEDLHASTRGWVGRTNVALAALLAHLGEVEARGIYRNKACASLHIYCVYVLRFSEDEAWFLLVCPYRERPAAMAT